MSVFEFSVPVCTQIQNLLMTARENQMSARVGVGKRVGSREKFSIKAGVTLIYSALLEHLC